MAAKEMSSPVRCICIIMAGPRQVKKCASTAGASVVLLLRCRCRCHLSTTPGLHVVQCFDESHLVVGWRRVPFFRLGLELPLDPCGLVWLHRKSSHAAGTRARGSCIWPGTALGKCRSPLAVVSSSAQSAIRPGGSTCAGFMLGERCAAFRMLLKRRQVQTRQVGQDRGKRGQG